MQLPPLVELPRGGTRGQVHETTSSWTGESQEATLEIWVVRHIRCHKKTLVVRLWAGAWSKQVEGTWVKVSRSGTSTREDRTNLHPNRGQVSSICSARKVKRERITPSTALLVGHGRTRKQIHHPCPSPFTRNRLAMELFLIFRQLLPTARTHHRIVSLVFVGKELCALVCIESLEGRPSFLITRTCQVGPSWRGVHEG